MLYTKEGDHEQSLHLSHASGQGRGPACIIRGQTQSEKQTNDNGRAGPKRGGRRPMKGLFRVSERTARRQLRASRWRRRLCMHRPARMERLHTYTMRRRRLGHSAACDAGTGLPAADRIERRLPHVRDCKKTSPGATSPPLLRVTRR